MNLSEIINLELPRTSATGLTRSQFDVEFEPATGTIWSWFNPSGNPCFSLGLLSDIRAHDSTPEANKGHVMHEGRLHKASYCS